MRTEKRCKKCGKLEMLGIDNDSALLWAHMWCKCPDEMIDSTVEALGKLAGPGVTLSNATITTEQLKEKG